MTLPVSSYSSQIVFVIIAGWCGLFPAAVMSPVACLPDLAFYDNELVCLLEF